jgi:autotransporter-associated beta strand protein
MRISWWRRIFHTMVRPRRRNPLRHPRLRIEFLEDRLVPSKFDMWIGAASPPDNQWTTAANWSDGVPTFGQTALFSGITNANPSPHANDPVIISTAQALDSIEIDAGYTNTITDSAALTLSTVVGGTGNFVQAGGTFDAGANPITVGGDWNITGGTFNAGGSIAIAGGWNVTGGTVNAGASTITIAGSWSVTGGTVNASLSTITVAGNWNGAGGTFDAGMGTVHLDGAAQSLTSGNNNAFANLTHDGTATGALTILDPLTVTGTLTNQSNSLDLNNQPTTAAATDITGGTLFASGSFNGGTITDNGTLIYDQSTNINVTNAISGSGTLELISTGGSITQSAAITVATLATTSRTGTALDNLGNAISSFSAANSTSGNVSLTNAATTLTVSGINETGGNVNVNNTGDISITGTISASGGQAVILTATGSLSETGLGLIKTTGTLTASAATGIMLSGVITNTVDTFTATNSTSGNISLTNTAAPLTVTSISEASGGTVTIGNTGAVTFPNALSGGYNLNDTSSGLSTFSAAVGSPTPLASVAITNDVAIDGGSVNTTGSQTYNGNVSLGADTTLTHTGAGSLSISGKTLYLGGFTFTDASTTAASTGTIAAQITSTITTSGGLTENGLGTLTLSGANTYTGTIAINGGTLQVGAPFAIPAASAITVAAGATLDLNNFNDAIFSLSGGGNVTLGSGGLTLDGGSGTTTFDGVFSGTGQLVKDGPGTVVITALNPNYTGTTFIVAGTLEVDGSLGGDVDFFTRGTTLSGTGTIGGNVVGSDVNFGIGNGKVAPGKANGVVGTLTIDGRLYQPHMVEFVVNAYHTPGVDFDQLIVNANGTVNGQSGVDLSGTTITVSGPTTAPSPQQDLTLIVNNSNSATVVGTNLVGATTTPADGATVTLAGGKTSPAFKIFYNGGVGGQDVTLVDATAPTIAYVDAGLTRTHRGKHVTLNGFGPSSISAIFGVNAFATINEALNAVANSGEVIVKGGTVTPVVYPEAVTLTGTETLTFTSGTLVTINSVATPTGATVALNGATLTLGDATSTTVAGLITGSGQLVKQGSGMLTLSGADTYTGTTTVTGGTLQVTGSLSSAQGSEIDLNAASPAGPVTLDGNRTGTVMRPVVVQATGALIENITIQAGTADGITLPAGVGNVTVADTTVTGSNHGIIVTGGTLTVVSSTITGNTADGIDVSAAGSATLVFDTVAFNAMGGLNNAGGNVFPADSLFADNGTFDYQGLVNNGAFNNLIQNVTSGTPVSAFGTNANFLNQPALLSPLGNYGGLQTVTLQTIALLPGSAALGNGSSIFQFLAGEYFKFVQTDERGIPPQSITNPDIGAFQSQPFTVTAVAPPAAGSISRTLIDNPFAANFQATVTSSQGDPVAGGRLMWTVPTPTGTASQIQSVSGNTITFAAPPGFANGELLLYNDGGAPNQPIGGLTPGVTYIASQVVGATLQLTTLSGQAITKLTAGTGANQTLTPATPSATTNYLIQGVTANNTITFAEPPGFKTDGTEQVVYDDGGGTNKPIGGLVEGGTYLAIATKVSTVWQLASLQTGKVIALTAGTGNIQTLVPALVAQTSAPGTVATAATAPTPTLLVANSIPSPPNGVNAVTGFPDPPTTYPLTASAGGQNSPVTWNLYNQLVTSMQLSGVPQSAQSGGMFDNPRGSGIQFNSAGTISNSLTVTLRDQELGPLTVAVSNQQVTLRATFQNGKAATINAVNGTLGSALTPAAGVFTNPIAAGQASFSRLQIYQSAFDTIVSPTIDLGYHLNVSYTNPGPYSTPVTAVSAGFSILPYQLAITASNFTGFLQKAFTIVIASSSRGEIRFLDIVSGANGLPSNAVQIQALDFTTAGVPALSTTYNGPITLSASNANGQVGLLLNGARIATTKQFLMTKGRVLITGLSPNVNFGEFSLIATTAVPGGSPSATSAGQTGVFIRINSGRQRGR